MGLDIVETFIAVETEFGIELPDAVAPRLETVGALFEYVLAQVSPEQLNPEDGQLYAGPLWDRYLALLARETGVRREHLRPEAYWVGDLGLD